MEENHRDNAENKLMTTENKPSLLLSEPEDEKEAQKELARLRKNEKGAFSSTYGRTSFQRKTLWDLVMLLATLLIPLVIVGATIGFGWWQAHLADLQHQSDQQRALDQQRAAILQTYMDNIQDLLLNHNLLKSNPYDPTNPYHDVEVLARAQTLTALEGLDPERKGRLLIFLHEVNLIGFLDNGEIQNNIIDLSGANLSNADLTGADLSGANLHDTFLVGANLSAANLSGALLGDADLSRANLAGADLSAAHLHEALYITQQQLDQVYSCTGAILPPGLTCNLNQ